MPRKGHLCWEPVWDPCGSMVGAEANIVGAAFQKYGNSVGASGDTCPFYNTKREEGRKNRPAEQSIRFLSRVLTFLEFYRSSFRSWSQAGTGFYSRLRHIPVVGRVLQPSAPHPCRAGPKE